MHPGTVKLIAVVLACAGIFASGWRLGSDHVVAGQAKDAALIQQAADAVELRTASRIAAIRVVNQTVSGKVREIVRESQVYRDCPIDPDLARLLDAARQGRSEPGPGIMPTPGPGAP